MIDSVNCEAEFTLFLTNRLLKQEKIDKAARLIATLFSTKSPATQKYLHDFPNAHRLNKTIDYIFLITHCLCDWIWEGNSIADLSEEGVFWMQTTQERIASMRDDANSSLFMFAIVKNHRETFENTMNDPAAFQSALKNKNTPEPIKQFFISCMTVGREEILHLNNHASPTSLFFKVLQRAALLLD